MEYDLEKGKLRNYIDFTSDDVSVFNVRVDTIKSLEYNISEIKKLVDVNESAMQAKLIAKVVDNTLKKLEETKYIYTVNEERQLTSFLKHNMLLKLPAPLVVTDTSMLSSRQDKQLLMCQYDRSKPDLCMFSDYTTGLLVTDEAKDNWMD